MFYGGKSLHAGTSCEFEATNPLRGEEVVYEITIDPLWVVDVSPEHQPEHQKEVE